eukprot:12125089-Karenia_brevis.AAC.1
MLSGGGKMVGKPWSELPCHAQFIDNDHFRMCLQIRLGIVEVPAGTTCQLTKAGGEERCLHAIAAPCEHPHLCKIGPARLRPHRAVMVAAKRTLERAGGEVDLERAVPSLYRFEPDGKVREAILDAVVITPGCLSCTMLDVTIRCPHSVRNGGGGASPDTEPAVASRDGETEKLLRYGPTVTPLSLETYGRMGARSMQGLRRLADSVATTGFCSRMWTGASLLAELRSEVERAL